MPILMLTLMLIVMLTLMLILMLTLMLILMPTLILIIIIIFIYIYVELDGAQSLSQYGQVSDVTDCEGNNKCIISVIFMLGMKLIDL